MSEEQGGFPVSQTPGTEPRPAEVQLAAVGGLFLGVLGILCVPCGLWNVYVGRPAESLVGAWALAAALVGLGLSILLVVGSMGLYRLTRWGRALILLYAVVSIALAIISAVFLRWQYLTEVAQTSPMLRGVGPWFALVGWAIGLLFAVYILYALTRPHVKLAFEQGIS